MTVEVVVANDVMERLSDEWRSFAIAPGNLVPTRVVITDGHVDAIGTLRRNPLHPIPVHFEYLLAEGCTTACLMSLFDGLVAAADLISGDPIHMTVDHGNQSLVAWAHRMGFIQRVMTWQCRLAPLALPEIPIPVGIRRLSDQDSPELRHHLAVLHACIYRVAHSWNPPGHLIDTHADDLFMGDDLLPSSLWYAVDIDGGPVGISSLRRSDVPDCVELGWIGTLPDVDPRLKESLIEVALRFAGTRTILIEVDDNESELIARLQQLPTEWESASIRFERDV